MSTQRDLQSIPYDILFQILGHLDASDPKSLFNFALVSKSCHSAAASLIFRDVSLTFAGPVAEPLDIQAATDFLENASAFQLVRRLNIRRGVLWRSYGRNPQTLPIHRRHRVERLEGLGFDEDDVPPNSHFTMPITIDPRLVVKNDADWKPLARFLEKFSCLCDLVWQCEFIFPPCLISALREHLPTCRLHIMNYHFTSTNGQQTWPHEIALATLPNLHRIHVLWASIDSSGFFNYNKEASMEVLAKLAPNLEEMRLFQGRPMSSPDIHPMAGSSKPIWKGFLSPDMGRVRTRKGKLKKLAFEGDRPMDVAEFMSWSACTDFAALRSLVVESLIDPDALWWLASERRFPALTNLEILFSEKNRYSHWDRRTKDVCALFIGSLEALSTVKILGSCSRAVFYALLERHGPRLRKLRLANFLAYEDPDMYLTITEMIVRFCPVFEELVLGISRIMTPPFSRS